MALKEKCILEEMQITAIYLNGTVFEQTLLCSVLFLNTYFLTGLNIFLKHFGFAVVSYVHHKSAGIYFNLDRSCWFTFLQ